MRRFLITLLVMMSSILALPCEAQEPARLALLIGNKGYAAEVSTPDRFSGSGRSDFPSRLNA